MTSTQHIFHTKHDFTPELGWAAFQLLSEVGSEGILLADLSTAANALASPLRRRSDLHKLLATMEGLDLVERKDERLLLSQMGSALASGIGQYEEGFRAAIHCIYFWKWIWENNKQKATPSWSYREVCLNILNAGAIGIDCDEIVLRVVGAASKFNTTKVSFSRSSVSGVTMWLEAQMPPLIQRKGNRLFMNSPCVPMAESLRLHLAALCALN